MKKQMFKILALLIFYILFINSCAFEPVEPEEQPSLMNAIVGSYPDPELSDNSYFDEIDDSTNLIIKSDYTYSLFFRGYRNQKDYTIRENGSFEVHQSKYDKNCGKALCFPYYEGKITFYPESKQSYGGQFTYYEINKAFSYQQFITMITENSIGIRFAGWRK